MEQPTIHATLWPEFEHFTKFENDERLSGIRVNSAMIHNPLLLANTIKDVSSSIAVPLYVDFKGRQPRVEEVMPNKTNLVMRMNHPLEAELPVTVLFKAGNDAATLSKIDASGRTLIFDGGPRFNVGPGESIHIRDDSFHINVSASVFSDLEKRKIEAVAPYCKQYYLSYVESQRDIDEFVELVGKDAFIWLKIETRDGLRFIANAFKKQPNIGLAAARGDLYLEVLRPHEILPAMKLVIEKDPQAMAASRIFLSVIGYKNPLVTYLLNKHPEDRDDHIVQHLIKPSGTPECHDFEELAWLHDLGYRNFLLCDEICLEETLLDIALNAFHAFVDSYAKTSKPPRVPTLLEFIKLKLGI